MKILIVYSSLTGNTKMIAEAINGKLSSMPEHNVSIFPVESAPDPDKYALIYMGFWADKGGADTKAKQYMEKIRNKTVALFSTMGVYPESDHAKQVLENAKQVLDKSNTVISRFSTLGKINPKIVEMTLKGGHGKLTPERIAKLEEAKKHPDAKDCADAADFATETLEKLKVKKTLVVYSSLTGNTKMIAEHVHKAFPGSELFDIDNAPEPEGYDLIFTGFWVHGGADPKSLKYFEKIQGKLTAPFFTLVAYPNSDRADNAFEDTKKRLEAGRNAVLGHFRCHGKLDPKIMERMKDHPGAEGARELSAETIARYEEAKKHPDETDCANAEKFAADILRKVTVC